MMCFPPRLHLDLWVSTSGSQEGGREPAGARAAKEQRLPGRRPAAPAGFSLSLSRVRVTSDRRAGGAPGAASHLQTTTSTPPVITRSPRLRGKASRRAAKGPRPAQAKFTRVITLDLPQPPPSISPPLPPPTPPPSPLAPSS